MRLDGVITGFSLEFLTEGEVIALFRIVEFDALTAHRVISSILLLLQINNKENYKIIRQRQ